MKLPRLLLPFFILHSSFFISASAKPGEQFPPLTQHENTAIFFAAPESARAAPQKPRKLLVFYRTEGFVHKSIPNANHALKLMGERTGAYAVTLSDDMAQFEPAALAAYDAVLFNNTSRLKFENPVHRQALLDFVRNGKGMIGIHAGSDNFPTWPEGQALMGGVFHSHPWVARDTVAVKNDDPGHILNTAFEKRGFWITEEIYQHVGPYSREKQRVLLSLDMSREENKRPANKIVRDDNDFGISWLKTEGKGRVFYTSLGHNKNIFEVPQILQHLLDGIQYALGDLEADAVPSAKLKTQPKPALAPDIKIPLQTLTALPSLKSLAAYEVGDPLGPQLTYEKYIRTQNAEQRAAIETELIALIAAPKTTAAAKRVFLNWLGWIGTEKSISALTAAAKDSDCAHAAISALAALNTTPPDHIATLNFLKADGALIKLLDDPTLTIEAINALGQRRFDVVVRALVKLTIENDPTAAAAAFEALGNISTTDAITMPQKFTYKGDKDLSRIRALLAAMNNALRRAPAEQTNSLRAQAIKIYAEILGTTTDLTAQIETAQALVSLDPVNPALFIFPADSDPRLRAVVACGMATSGNAAAIKILTDNFDVMTSDTWCVALNVLASKPDTVALPFVERALASTNTSLRLAAIAAAGTCGDNTTVAKLFPLLASENKDISAAAFTALTQLPDCDGQTDSALRTPHPAFPPAKQLLILAQRQDRVTFPNALAATASDDNDLRAAAFESAALLVREGDFPQIVGLIANVKRPADRREWTKALYTSAAAHPDAAAAVALIEKQLPSAKPADRATLIATLTMIDAPDAKTALNAKLTATDIDVRKETIRALSSARTQTALDLLTERITAAPDASERLLAQRGAIDTVDQLGLSTNDKVSAYRKLWKVVNTQEGKDAIIAAVKRIKGSAATKFLKEIEPKEEKFPGQT